MVCGSKSRLAKAAGAEPLLEVEMSKKCTPLWREEDSKSKVQKLAGTGHFWPSDVVSCDRHKGLCTVSKVRKT